MTTLTVGGAYARCTACGADTVACSMRRSLSGRGCCATCPGSHAHTGHDRDPDHTGHTLEHVEQHHVDPVEQHQPDQPDAHLTVNQVGAHLTVDQTGGAYAGAQQQQVEADLEPDLEPDQAQARPDTNHDPLHDLQPPLPFGLPTDLCDACPASAEGCTARQQFAGGERCCRRCTHTNNESPPNNAMTGHSFSTDKPRTTPG